MTRLDRPEGRPSEVGTSADLTLIRSERPSAVALCGDAEPLALRLLDAIGPAALAAVALAVEELLAEVVR